MTTMITRAEFDAEMAEWHRRSNERWSAANADMDRISATLAEARQKIREASALSKETAALVAEHGISLDALWRERFTHDADGHGGKP